mmetsp:Transcript_8759/g.25098  ORF Transcript_8759/g.25098 Transcript_8759/m.25098 type:complete len:320 (-) Transcript_8759:692-1651(-)
MATDSPSRIDTHACHAWPVWQTSNTHRLPPASKRTSVFARLVHRVCNRSQPTEHTHDAQSGHTNVRMKSANTAIQTSTNRARNNHHRSAPTTTTTRPSFSRKLHRPSPLRRSLRYVHPIPSCHLAMLLGLLGHEFLGQLVDRCGLEQKQPLRPRQRRAATLEPQLLELVLDHIRMVHLQQPLSRLPRPARSRHVDGRRLPLPPGILFLLPLVDLHALSLIGCGCGCGGGRRCQLQLVDGRQRRLRRASVVHARGSVDGRVGGLGGDRGGGGSGAGGDGRRRLEGGGWHLLGRRERRRRRLCLLLLLGVLVLFGILVVDE